MSGAITLLRFLLLRQGVVVAASQGGKAKTFLQTIALGLLILPLRGHSGGWDVVGTTVWWIAVITMAGAVAITLWTGGQYVVHAMSGERTADETPAA